MVLFQLDLPCSCKKLWPKRCFCWLFGMTYNVWIHIFPWMHFLNLRDEDELYWIVFYSKWALDEKFLIKYEEVMPGQSFVDFSYRNPNLATFECWWIRRIPWGIMIKPWSNDGFYFKMLMLTKNLEVWLYVGHIWILT